MPMIVNIRGTHGSGKSTVVRTLIKRFNGVPTELNKRGKPENYKLTLSNGDSLYVVGGYANACGGCDAIQPYSDIWPRVERFAAQGHVLFEGALISCMYGAIGRASEAFGDQFVFAFMNTPLEVCLNRIRKRREAKGNNKPLNPNNTRSKLETITKSIDTIRDKHGRRVAVLNWINPYPRLMELFTHDRRD